MAIQNFAELSDKKNHSDKNHKSNKKNMNDEIANERDQQNQV